MLTTQRTDQPTAGVGVSASGRTSVRLPTWRNPSRPVLRPKAVTRCKRLLVVAVVLAGCSSSVLGDVSIDGYTSTWRGPDGAPAVRGSVLDRTFEVQTIAGSDHCGWEDVVFLIVGWPLGTTHDTWAESRQYIRDEDGDIDHPTLLSTFDADVDLPEGARSSGYQNEAGELWFGPDNGDEAAYVQLDGRVERWPRTDELLGCE